jgi:hypothetical protein
MYYHEVGYYSLGVPKSCKKRGALMPHYTVMTGRDA